jgi:hypothetical protein
MPDSPGDPLEVASLEIALGDEAHPSGMGPDGSRVDPRFRRIRLQPGIDRPSREGPSRDSPLLFLVHSGEDEPASRIPSAEVPLAGQKPRAEYHSNRRRHSVDSRVHHLLPALDPHSETSSWG